MSDPQQPHGLQPTRLLHPWDFPGRSNGVGCHCLLRDENYESTKKLSKSKAKEMRRKLCQSTAEPNTQNQGRRDFDWAVPHSMWDFISKFLNQRSNSCPLTWKHEVLTTGPPGNSNPGASLATLILSHSPWHRRKQRTDPKHRE